MADTLDEGLATAIQLWKGINLSNLQRDLDQQGLEIVENQKDSLLSRKKLAEQTRDFKKIPDEEKLQQFKVLLKGSSSSFLLLCFQPDQHYPIPRTHPTQPHSTALANLILSPISFCFAAYQGEIDSITRRTKFAENAFLSLYKVLAEAPDPSPLFEVALLSRFIYVRHALMWQLASLGTKLQALGAASSPAR
ncbi:hypothetical protein BC937DRAFT_92031 [Endogone sp. FLAS-F59071]|nr:hypothetical protein BC937DRAFT_92031 [Endogone sp. FLAS-F59071]|eukprot:RUS15762.1 hypothetical protein BC937DRAFT_92031 [Endogone sp. FLAS-F59071]